MPNTEVRAVRFPHLRDFSDKTNAYLRSNPGWDIHSITNIPDPGGVTFVIVFTKSSMNLNESIAENTLPEFESHLE